MACTRRPPSPDPGRIAGGTRPELSLVLPAHDEEARIGPVAGSWVEVLDRWGLDFEILAFDDASGDRTGEILRALSRADPRVVVTRHEVNRGHGPTLLEGYRAAAGEWIFQADGDGEVPADGFPELWEARLGRDFVIGRRSGGAVRPARRMTSALARMAVSSWFGGDVGDVNCPFRLMRGARLRELLDFVPEDTFAPNVILTGLAVRHGFAIGQVPVSRRPSNRESADSEPANREPTSLGGWRLLRGAARGAWQTARAARLSRREPRA